MNRRGFFSFLGAAVAGASVDIKKLFGLISAPKPRVSVPLTINYWTGGDFNYNEDDDIFAMKIFPPIEVARPWKPVRGDVS